MLKRLFLYLFSASFLVSIGQINSGSPNVPFGSNNSYEYGMMPTNLPSSGTYGSSSDAATAWDEFKIDFIENCGTNAARVKFDTQSETVSEGIAYGMLLAAYAADQDVFNRLWQFYKNHRNGNGVMNWKISGCNTAIGFNGATDAEVDAAMALIVADKQWGSTGQVHDYKADAISLINIIKQYEINSSDYTFENGDAWKPDCRNPSYQAPGYTRVWENFMNENGEDGTFWGQVATATETLHKTNSNTYSSGLASNWCRPDGIANSSCSGSGTNWASFGYDACRAPWRQSIDYLWHGSTANGIQGIINTQINFWIGNGGASDVSGGDSRHQNGSGSGDHVGAFLGMIGAQSLASSNTTAHQSFVNDMYLENIAVDQSAYFNKILRCMGLFVQTGNFWNPYAVGASASPISIAFTSPTATTFSQGENITFQVNASSTSSSITKVEFIEGTTILSTDINAPYQFSTSILSTGNHTIIAKAYDSNGETKTVSLTISVLGTILGTDVAPTIDGTIDAIWADANTIEIGNELLGDISNSADLSASYKALWDDTYLYVLVEVTDDSKRNNSTELYNDDGVELFLDINNDKPASPSNDDYQFQFRWDDNQVVENWNNDVSAVNFAQGDFTGGYIIEIRVNWSDVGENNPSAGTFLGIDVEINDDDNDGDDNRDAKIAWAATVDQAWQDPSLLGTLLLSEITLGNNCVPPSNVQITNGGLEGSFCTDDNLVLNANIINGYTYQWYRNGNPVDQGALNNTTLTATESGTYKVRIADGDLNNNACYLESNDFTVTEVLLPLAQIDNNNSDFEYCSTTENGAFVSAIDAGTGAVYQWVKTGENTITGNTVQLEEGTYTLEVEKDGCSSSAISFDVIEDCPCVKPSTAIINNTNNTFCTSEDLTLTANLINNQLYQWYRNGVAITTGTFGDNSFVASQEGLYTVRIADQDLNDASCYTESPEFSVTETTLPVAALDLSNSSLIYCDLTQLGGNVMATEAGVTATYEWEKTGGGTITGQNVTLDEGEYVLNVSKDNCNNSSEPITIVNDCDVVLGTVSLNFSAPTLASYAFGEIVTFEVNASTTQGTISNVTFSEGNNVLLVDNAAPFAFSTSNLSVGVHNITATAINSNNVEASENITITVVETISKTGITPIIDGNIDGLWENVQSYFIEKEIVGTVTNANDLSASFKTLWDDNNLYVLVDVTDDSKRNNSTNSYQDDAVEIFIDIDNDKASTYGTNDFQFTFGYNDAVASEANIGLVTGIVFEQTDKTDGYIIEVSIPWTLLSTSPELGDFIGFDVAVNDDDVGNTTRNAKIAWETDDDLSWTDPSLFGTVALGPEVQLCTQPSNVSITNGFDQNLCQGDILTVFATAGTSEIYRWYKDGINIGSANTLDITEGGVYKLRVANLNLDDSDCYIESTSFDITEIDLPIANIVTSGDDLKYCEGDNGVSLVAQVVSEATFIWSNNTNNRSIQSVVEGTYTVTVEKDNCRNISAPVEVELIPSPLAEINENTSVLEFCEGDPSLGTLILKTAGSGSSYVWDNGIGSGIQRFGVPANQYTATVTKDGCQSTVSVNVIERPKPNVSEITGVDTVCLGNSRVSVTLSLPDISGSTYTWNTQVGTITSVATENSVTVELTTEQDGEVTVFETSEYGCVSDVTTKSFVFDCLTRLWEKEDNINISVYPNPFVDYVYTDKEVNYELFLQNGQLIKSGEFTDTGINLIDLPQGVYLLKLSDNEGIKIVKLIKTE